MMEKPIHVRVAEALGWTNLTETPPPLPGMDPHWLGDPPEWYARSHTQYVADIDYAKRTLTIRTGSIPRYDTDWSATGPLLERFNISIVPAPHGGYVALELRGRSPHIEVPFHRSEPTMLQAACALLISGAPWPTS